MVDKSKSASMGSARKDRRGHWPRGKRRGVTSAKRVQAVDRLRRRIESGRISRRGAAVALCVSDRTIGRWLRGEDYPIADNLDALLSWLSSRHSVVPR